MLAFGHRDTFRAGGEPIVQVRILPIAAVGVSVEAADRSNQVIAGRKAGGGESN